jgi:hypothetical protein
LTNFQSSPDCIEFLRNLPEDAADSPQASIESVSQLKHLTLGGDSSGPPEPSRFLVLNHATEAATPEAWGLVTLTTFLVPHQVDDKFEMWEDKFRKPFSVFAPRGSEFVTGRRNFRHMSSYVWYWVRGEDRWMEERFGKPEQQVQQDNQGRTIFCHFFLWSPYHATPEEHEAAAEGEKALAADPEARESWNGAIARVMPPATAWVQERWNIEEVPRVYPPEPDIEDLEYETTLQRLRDEFFHRSKPGERS